MKNAFAHNAFAASGGISQTAADARYVLKASGSFTGLTGAGFRDTSAAFDVTLVFTSSVALDAGRALTIDMGNVAHTIVLGATAGTITFPNHAALTVAGLQIANVFTAVQASQNGFSVQSNTSGTGFKCQNLAGDTTLLVLDGGGGLQMCQNHGIGWNDAFSAGSNRLRLHAQAGVSGVLTLGNWQGSATPAAKRIAGEFGAGTDITGGTLNIGTQGTGAGTGGAINFQSHAAGASSSTLGTLVTVASVLSDRFKIASGMTLQLGVAAATEVIVPDSSLIVVDANGNSFKLAALAI